MRPPAWRPLRKTFVQQSNFAKDSRELCTGDPIRPAEVKADRTLAHHTLVRILTSPCLIFRQGLFSSRLISSPHLEGGELSWLSQRTVKKNYSRNTPN